MSDQRRRRSGGRGGASGGGSGGGSGRGGRSLAQRVRSARGRPVGSTLWLQRQLNDPYVKEAQARGFRSRAAFKLEQLHERFGLIAPGQKVVDLGSAPGGWLQVAVGVMGSDKDGKGLARGGRLVGIDLLPVDPLPGVVLIEGDFLDDDMPERLRAGLGGPADLVLSDMAANTIGHKKTDHLRTMALAETAAHFALEVLAPGGAFVTKVLQGGTESELLTLLKKSFSSVRHVKPPSSRKDSSEMYLVAQGFRGSGDSAASPEA